MLDALEALLSLEATGTVREAAVQLRLTQSAVSKRLQGLQRQVGVKLLEPDGRRLRITPEGRALLERARPLLAELRQLTEPRALTGSLQLSLALSDSLASSWGPRLLRSVLSRRPAWQLDLHVHRSVLILESVRLGRYQAGLCAPAGPLEDLVEIEIAREPFVLFTPAHMGKIETPLITIESTSASWRQIEASLREHHPELLRRPLLRVESFAAVLAMSRAGFGRALVPAGLVTKPGRGAHVKKLKGVERKLSLVFRKLRLQDPLFEEFARLLQAEARLISSEASR